MHGRTGASAQRRDRDVRPYEDKVSGEWRKRERGTEDKKEGDGRMETEKLQLTRGVRMGK